jgi:S-(hydroxymethyl)glutathione dehydrogenase/alcohol dehydrogenase
MLPSRLGVSVIIGVAASGRRSAPGRFSSSPAGCEGLLGGAKGRRDVPKIVDWYMDGKINIDDLITHTLPLADINKGFD